MESGKIRYFLRFWADCYARAKPARDDEGSQRGADIHADLTADTADSPHLVRTEVSALLQVSAPAAEPLPSEACSLSAMVVGGAQDLAVLLLRLGLARAAVTEHVDGWLAQQRGGAIDCMAEDVPPPVKHDTWASHPLFLGPWLEGTSWHELEAEAAATSGVRP